VVSFARSSIRSTSVRYPHLSFADKVGSVQLFNLLADWAPDEATRRRILVDNPAALFGFSR